MFTKESEFSKKSTLFTLCLLLVYWFNPLQFHILYVKGIKAFFWRVILYPIAVVIAFFEIIYLTTGYFPKSISKNSFLRQKLGAGLVDKHNLLVMPPVKVLEIALLSINSFDLREHDDLAKLNPHKNTYTRHDAILFPYKPLGLLYLNISLQMIFGWTGFHLILQKRFGEFFLRPFLLLFTFGGVYLIEVIQMIFFYSYSLSGKIRPGILPIIKAHKNIRRSAKYDMHTLVKPIKDDIDSVANAINDLVETVPEKTSKDFNAINDVVETLPEKTSKAFNDLSKTSSKITTGIFSSLGTMVYAGTLKPIFGHKDFNWFVFILPFLFAYGIFINSQDLDLGVWGNDNIPYSTEIIIAEINDEINNYNLFKFVELVDLVGREFASEGPSYYFVLYLFGLMLTVSTLMFLQIIQNAMRASGPTKDGRYKTGFKNNYTYAMAMQKPSTFGPKAIPVLHITSYLSIVVLVFLITNLGLWFGLYAFHRIFMAWLLSIFLCLLLPLIFLFIFRFGF
jgi:hypothetical protein